MVSPLLKKAGLDRTFSNFRPVNSNLAFVSKIVERVVVDQLMVHSDNFAPLPEVQSAYRKNHSTETALLKVQSDILMKMDNQEVCLLVLLDLSAAFDTVDVDILLQTMEMDFGVSDLCLQWLKSYLSGRKQCVVINGNKSKQFSLHCGVPQGSCLGPILFLFYMSRLYHIISRHLPDAHGYSDDNQLYMSFRPLASTNQQRAVCETEACIADVRAWMIVNELLINDLKTEFMLIGSRQMLQKVDMVPIRVGEALIPPVESVRNLGVFFDKNMSMETHVSRVSSKAFMGLYKIRQIRRFLSVESTTTLVHAFVTSHIDYCNSVLYGISGRQLSRLQRVLNAAARVVCLVPRFDHITPVLMRLHWLPVKYRIVFKVLLLTYKAIHGVAPAYLCDMVRLRQVSTHHLRSVDTPTLVVPRTKCKTFGDRSFYKASPVLWNQLPSNIRLAGSIDIFKTLLKQHLFSECFGV